jgi:hypothetical protein
MQVSVFDAPVTTQRQLSASFLRGKKDVFFIDVSCFETQGASRDKVSRQKSSGLQAMGREQDIPPLVRISPARSRSQGCAVRSDRRARQDMKVRRRQSSASGKLITAQESLPLPGGSSADLIFILLQTPIWMVCFLVPTPNIPPCRINSNPLSHISTSIHMDLASFALVLPPRRAYPQSVPYN